MCHFFIQAWDKGWNYKKLSKYVYSSTSRDPNFKSKICRRWNCSLSHTKACWMALPPTSWNLPSPRISHALHLPTTLMHSLCCHTMVASPDLLGLTYTSTYLLLKITHNHYLPLIQVRVQVPWYVLLRGWVVSNEEMYCFHTVININIKMPWSDYVYLMW